MYIVAIAWMYVILMMSVTEKSITAGVMTFVFYGLVPVLILLYLMGTPQRKRNRQRAAEMTAAAQREKEERPSDRPAE